MSVIMSVIRMTACSTFVSTCVKLRAENDNSRHMVIKTHLGKNGIYDACLDGIALRVHEKSMLEGVCQGRFIVDRLIDQLCFEACHGRVFDSFCHLSHLGLSLFKFERPRAIEVDVET